MHLHILLVSLLLSNTLAQGRVYSRAGLNAKKILTPPVKAWIQDVQSSLDVPGISVAVVQNTDDPEFGTWGIRSEDGDAMTSDVRRPAPYFNF